MAAIALLLAIVSLVVTLLQSPVSPTNALSDAPLISISGGSLIIGSSSPWRFDPQSLRMHYNSKNIADQVIVKLNQGKAEDQWIREAGTPLSISLRFGEGINERIALLTSDRNGQNLELTITEREKRIDSSYLQVMPNLLRDPSDSSKITHVEVQGCHRKSQVNGQGSYDLMNEGILLLVESGS